MESIDLLHLGRDPVIGAYEPRPGVIVDPGPASCVDALLAGVREAPTSATWPASGSRRASSP